MESAEGDDGRMDRTSVAFGDVESEYPRDRLRKLVRSGRADEAIGRQPRKKRQTCKSKGKSRNSRLRRGRCLVWHRTLVAMAKRISASAYHGCCDGRMMEGNVSGRTEPNGAERRGQRAADALVVVERR
ncbi:hypothetical protein L1887_49067 [Cichorium endivia]|nr:hypothetical protein L1887_49067 [Cichorium endivia]